MLHRPFIDQAGLGDYSSSYTSRSTPLLNPADVCLESGLQLARIFEVSRTRFDVRQSFIMAMQQAGTGVIALIEGIARSGSARERQKPMRHLLFLRSVLYELGHVYQHASRMSRVVDMVLEESGWEAEFRALAGSTPCDVGVDGTGIDPDLSGVDKDMAGTRGNSMFHLGQVLQQQNATVDVGKKMDKRTVMFDAGGRLEQTIPDLSSPSSHGTAYLPQTLGDDSGDTNSQRSFGDLAFGNWFHF